ncbi:MAG: NAD-binding protein [Desulfobacterales bacterium]
MHGDASKPAILSQVNPKDCDFLFCLADSDQVNIITALLGRSMGFKRVVPSIEDDDLQQLCSELELEDTIIPVRTRSQYLVTMVRGLDSIELPTFLKHDARLFTFVAGKRRRIRSMNWACLKKLQLFSTIVMINLILLMKRPLFRRVMRSLF